VSPEQAEILILASAEGKVQLVLRNSTDSRVEMQKGTHLTTLYGVGIQQVEPAPVQRASREKKSAEPVRIEVIKVEALPAAPVVHVPKTIEVIRGSKKSLDPIDSPTDPKKSPK